MIIKEGPHDYLADLPRIVVEEGEREMRELIKIHHSPLLAARAFYSRHHNESEYWTHLTVVVQLLDRVVPNRKTKR